MGPAARVTAGAWSGDHARVEEDSGEPEASVRHRRHPRRSRVVPPRSRDGREDRMGARDGPGQDRSHHQTVSARKPQGPGRQIEPKTRPAISRLPSQAGTQSPDRTDHIPTTQGCSQNDHPHPPCRLCSHRFVVAVRNRPRRQRGAEWERLDSVQRAPIVVLIEPPAGVDRRRISIRP